MGVNSQTAASTPCGLSSFATTPRVRRESSGWLDTTAQCAGAVTVKRNAALRSGCSNTANMRRESGTSNWV